MTNDEIDQAIKEPIERIGSALVGAGRSRHQALQDIRRVVNRFEAEMNKEEGVIVHRCPPIGSNEMPCCGRSPFARMADRMTLEDGLVSCDGK